MTTTTQPATIFTDDAATAARAIIASRGASRVAAEVAAKLASIPEGVAVELCSSGGGLDSWVMLLNGFNRGELPHLVIFCDVGNPNDLTVPGEWPSTYRHIAEVVIPFCLSLGIPFVTIDSNDYPVRAHAGNPGGCGSLFEYFEMMRLMPGCTNGMCTAMSKVERANDWIADYLGDRAVNVWIGFGADEDTRALNSDDPYARYANENGNRTKRYPLRESNLCRCREERMARESGYPVPRKSACTMCPKASKGDFQTMRAELPQTFDRIADLESNCRKTKSGATITYGRQTVDGVRQPVSLRVYTDASYKAVAKPCGVCGAELRSTKRVGCSYLPQAEAVAPELDAVTRARVIAERAAAAAVRAAKRDAAKARKAARAAAKKAAA